MGAHVNRCYNNTRRPGDTTTSNSRRRLAGTATPMRNRCRHASCAAGERWCGNNLNHNSQEPWCRPSTAVYTHNTPTSPPTMATTATTADMCSHTCHTVRTPTLRRRSNIVRPTCAQRRRHTRPTLMARAGKPRTDAGTEQLGQPAGATAPSATAPPLWCGRAHPPPCAIPWAPPFPPPTNKARGGEV